MGQNPQHTFLILTKRPEIAPRHESWWFPNIWLGVTAENQKRADERIPILLQIPAKVRFVSVEPMLEQINIPYPFLKPRRIGWIICGAETGPGARPMKDEWAISLNNQCMDARVPFFFKKPSKGSYLVMPREYPK
jgi:protein gp37